VDFNELVEQAPGKQKSGKEDKLPAVIRLKDEGKTFEEIAELLNISKSTAQRWFTEAKEKSHPKTP
jgi:transposase